MARTVSILSNSTFFTVLIIGMVVIFVSLFAPLFISSDLVRGRISEFIESRTGMKASVSGDVSLTLFPSLKIRAKDIALSPKNKEGLLKRSPLTIREISVHISYAGFMAGAAPERVVLRSPTLYMRRIDLEKEKWADVLLSAQGKPYASSQGYVSELWKTLQRICNEEGGSFDVWRESAGASLRQAEASGRVTEDFASSMASAVCPEQSIQSFVRMNWGMFAEYFYQNSGTDSGGLIPALKKLAGYVEIESASVIYDAFDKQYRVDLIDAVIRYNKGFSLEGSVRGVRDPLFYSLNYSGFGVGDTVNLSVYAEGVLKMNALGRLEQRAEGMVAVYNGDAELTDSSKLDALFISETGIFRSFSYDKPISMTFSGEADSQGFDVSQGVVNSPALKADLKGAIRYEGSYDGDFDVSTVVRVSYMDMDRLFSQQKTDTESFDIDTGGAAFRLPQMRLNLPRLLALHTDIEAKSVILQGKEISGFILEADIYSGRASLHRLEVNLPGDSVFTVDGYVEHNGTRPLFLGRVRASGEHLREVVSLAFPEINNRIPKRLLEDFSLKADIRMTPVSMVVDDILLTFDNASLRGNITLDYIDTTSASNVTLTLDRFDADMYGVSAYLLEELRNVPKSSFMDSGNVEAFIRNLSSQMRLVLKAEDGRFNRRNIRRAEVIVDYGPGVFSVDKFFVESGEVEPSRKSDINAYARLTVPEQGVPKAKISWKSEYLNTDMFFIRGALEDMLKNDISKEDRPYPYFIFDRFSTDYTMSIDNLYHGNTKISSSNYIQGESRSAIMRIIELRSRLFGNAYLAAKARISMTSIMSLGVSFSALRMPLGKLSEYFPDLFRKPMSGRLDIQGRVQTSGIGKRQMLSRLNVDGRFETKNLRIKDMDLKRIYASSVNTISVVDVKQEIRRGLTQGETEFDTVSGSIKTSRAKEPHQIELRDVTLKTPYSLSNYALNYNAADDIFYSILMFGFRPAPDESLKLRLSSQKSSDGSYVTEVDDAEIIRFVTAKTEGVN